MRNDKSEAYEGEELQAELFSYNIFMITMVGAVAFCIGCAFVVMH